MKNDEKLDKILETVTEIRLDQVRHEMRIDENTKDIKEQDEQLDKLKADNAKFKGAGLLVGLVSTFAGIYKGFFQ